MAARLSRHGGIEHHEADVEIVNDVLQETVLPNEMSVRRKDTLKHTRIVMITNYQMNGHRQRRQQFGQHLISSKVL